MDRTARQLRSGADAPTDRRLLRNMFSSWFQTVLDARPPLQRAPDGLDCRHARLPDFQYPFSNLVFVAVPGLLDLTPFGGYTVYLPELSPHA